MLNMRMMMAVCAGGALACASVCAWGQSLFHEPVDVVDDSIEDPAEPLYAVSLFAIEPPKPREFAPHDLVTIVVVETSNMKHEQKLDADKEYELDTMRLQIPELLKFIALNGAAADVNPLAELGVDHTAEFAGEGKYKRTDDIRARVTAQVVEVKPNGTLLVEARTRIQTDEEVQEFRLSGMCRAEDVTEQNTVLSNQLFELAFEVKHEGEVADVNRKGLFTEVLETLFAF